LMFNVARPPLPAWPPADLRQPFPVSIQLLSPPGISKSASQVERIELEDHERNFSEGALFAC